MDYRKLFSQTHKVSLTLCLTVLGGLTGCVVEGPRAEVYAEPPTFAVQDDYVYYPNYQCYYSVSRHQYAYREGRVWVARSAPPHVSVNVFMASPSVRMDFHDSPAQHHNTVVKQYPKNWKPANADKGQNRRDDQHDQRDHDENHGK